MMYIYTWRCMVDVDAYDVLYNNRLTFVDLILIKILTKL